MSIIMQKKDSNMVCYVYQKHIDEIKRKTKISTKLDCICQELKIGKHLPKSIKIKGYNSRKIKYYRLSSYQYLLKYNMGNSIICIPTKQYKV